MMRVMRFLESWISLIRECISSVTYSFILNGKVKVFIRPSRGLRYGDNLSPNFFLICAEGLSSLISQAVWGEYSGFKCSHQGPKITHLFFADDSLLFTKATLKDCVIIRNILEHYFLAFV